jgi:hypothetical protein
MSDSIVHLGFPIDSGIPRFHMGTRKVGQKAINLLCQKGIESV